MIHPLQFIEASTGGNHAQRSIKYFQVELLTIPIINFLF